MVICNPSGSKVRHTGWNFLGPQIALQMTCNGQIAEPNTNEHVLAGALQGNLQLSPNFFWYFSHHIHIFLTLSQDFLTIFWIFQPGLMPRWYVPNGHDAVDRAVNTYALFSTMRSNYCQNYLGHLSPKASSSHISLDIWANMKISSPKARATHCSLRADKSMSMPKLILFHSKYYYIML